MISEENTTQNQEMTAPVNDDKQPEYMYAHEQFFLTTVKIQIENIQLLQDMLNKERDDHLQSTENEKKNIRYLDMIIDETQPSELVLTGSEDEKLNISVCLFTQPSYFYPNIVSSDQDDHLAAVADAKQSTIDLKNARLQLRNQTERAQIIEKRYQFINQNRRLLVWRFFNLIAERRHSRLLDPYKSPEDNTKYIVPGIWTYSEEDIIRIIRRHASILYPIWDMLYGSRLSKHYPLQESMLLWRCFQDADVEREKAAVENCRNTEQTILNIRAQMLETAKKIKAVRSVIVDSNNAYEKAFPGKFAEKQNNFIDSSLRDLHKLIEPQRIQKEFEELSERHVDWKRGEIQTRHLSYFCFGNHFDHVDMSEKRSDRQGMAGALLDRITKEYGNFIIDCSQTNMEFGMFFPNMLKINATDFRLIIDASSTETSSSLKHKMLGLAGRMSDSTGKFRMLAQNSFTDRYTGCKYFIQNFVANATANLLPGKVRYLFCDPESSAIFTMFRGIGRMEKNDSGSCEYAFTDEEIASRLKAICAEIGNIITEILPNENTTLYEYNRLNRYNSHPYQFIILADFPRRMTMSSLDSLQSIIKGGARCGIFPIIIYKDVTAMQMLSDNERAIAQSIVNNCDLVIDDFSVRIPSKYANNENNFLFGVDEQISSEEFADYIQLYNKTAINALNYKVDIHDLGGEICRSGQFKIPIGRNVGGDIEYLRFFNSCQNYVMSGAIGTGKSNALHVILRNALKYVPDLELYLLDFKHGVEFAPYAQLHHKAFKVLSIESAPEFGYQVLLHIKNKAEQISHLFKDVKVSDWQGYQRETGKTIPVTLVIMDEVQYLFSGEHSAECSTLIEEIAKTYRVFNIHLLLASQTLNTIGGLTPAAMGQMIGRIVFFNDDLNEYSYMLGSENNLARNIKSSYKGQSVIATQHDHQTMVKFALMEKIEDMIKDLSAPANEPVQRTKIMLFAQEYNPECFFNRYLNDQADLTAPFTLKIGDDIMLEDDDIHKRFSMANYTSPVSIDDEDQIVLGDRPDDNLLIIGNKPRDGESVFIPALMEALIKAAENDRVGSITLFAPAKCKSLAFLKNRFQRYLRIFTTKDELVGAVDENTEYLFIYDLQAFPSLRIEDIAAPSSAAQIKMDSFIIGKTAVNYYIHPESDSTMFRSALCSDKCRVIVWQNSVQSVKEILPLFRHKVGFTMEAESDSIMLVGSNACSKLSERVMFYKCHNDERILRSHDCLSEPYLEKVAQKLESRCKN